VATHYSIRHKVLVAAAILQGADAANDDLSSPRGIYGGILIQLVVQPGVPEGGWKPSKRDPYRFPWPAWYDEASYGELVERARRYGLHRKASSNNHGVQFVGNKAFSALLDEDAKYRQQCKDWYIQARHDFTAQIERNHAHAEHLRAMRREFTKLMNANSSTAQYPEFASPEALRKLVTGLTKILDSHFPEW
jgi:pimeloyl-ACP methyl ester carboxylesterase